MKVVIAATEEQIREIKHLTDYIYSSIFPKYFNDQEIARFVEMEILLLNDDVQERLHVRSDAFQAIASLQTIIHILEQCNVQKDKVNLSLLFNENVKKLARIGLFFPFLFKNFTQLQTKEQMSIYSNPSTHLLM